MSKYMSRLFFGNMFITKTVTTWVPKYPKSKNYQIYKGSLPKFIADLEFLTMLENIWDTNFGCYDLAKDKHLTINYWTTNYK